MTQQASIVATLVCRMNVFCSGHSTTITDDEPPDAQQVVVPMTLSRLDCTPTPTPVYRLNPHLMRLHAIPPQSNNTPITARHGNGVLLASDSSGFPLFHFLLEQASIFCILFFFECLDSFFVSHVFKEWHTKKMQDETWISRPRGQWRSFLLCSPRHLACHHPDSFGLGDS